MSEQACADHSREIWSSSDDMKSQTIHMVGDDAMRMCLYGLCVTMPLDKWHGLAADDVKSQVKLERENILLRAALRPFADLPETSEAETAVPNESPVTIRCQLGDMRRAFKALHPD